LPIINLVWLSVVIAHCPEQAYKHGDELRVRDANQRQGNRYSVCIVSALLQPY
jgi:hypothetical protein